MTGFRTGKERVEYIKHFDLVRTPSGRTARVLKVVGKECFIRTTGDAEDEFWIKAIHLTLVDRPFGAESDKAPQPTRNGG